VKREETDWHTDCGRRGSRNIWKKGQMDYPSSGAGPPKLAEGATMVERRSDTEMNIRDMDDGDLVHWSKRLSPHIGKRDKERGRRENSASPLTEDPAGS
jgi:hypothetical protein